MPAAAGVGERRSSRLLFTATIFAGSFLLFLIQPMIARMALPRLGGAPAVWNSALLVYQTLLLGGYAYAHWLTRYSPRTQALAHGTALAAAALLLPVGLSAHSLPPGSSAYLWVPWLLVSSIGPLFFLISANAPLLQRWFASSGGEDPYPLFAASNLGSFAGLIAHPLLLEPLLPVSAQRLVWTAGYGLLFLLVLGCAVSLNQAQLRKEEPASAKLSLRNALRWVWLAFIPSGLLLSTTLFITTDIMPMPLLWVVPLGLYLLSFTIAFASRSGPARWLSLFAPYTLVPAAVFVFIGARIPLALTAAFLVVALFAISVACHFKIYETRPEPQRLTGFYLAVAAGGVAGGIFCALIAPLIFDWTYEFPILLIAAAVALLPGESPIIPPRWLQGRRAGWVVGALSALVLVAAAGAVAVWKNEPDLARYGGLVVLLCGVLAVASRPLLIAMMVAAMILAGAWKKLELSAEPGRMMRTYFGIYSILEPGYTRQLMHGTTLHGIQVLTPGWETYPTTYYGRESGVGRALLLVPALFGDAARVSVVGLGTGTLACYKQDGQDWTFFELDPAVARLARHSGQFTFLERCSPDASIVVGDARLELAKAGWGEADVLVVDAFSSDAVPMHLLTREAFQVYARHLKPEGLLLVHISNRHLDLAPVVAAAPGWHARQGDFGPEWDHRHLTDSHWMALSRSPATIDALSRASDHSFWKRPPPRRVPWTDDYASLIPIFK